MELSLHFKHVDQEYAGLVRRWLSLPHVMPWFYGQGLQNTLLGIDAFLQGEQRAQYWLVFDKAHPFAFFITSFVDKPKDDLTQFCQVAGVAMTLDMLIGDLNYLGKGLASNLIQQFLRSRFPHVAEVLIDPEATNQRAIHVYQQAGFQIIGTFTPSHSPHLHCMMRLNMQKLFSTN